MALDQSAFKVNSPGTQLQDPLLQTKPQYLIKVLHYRTNAEFREDDTFEERMRSRLSDYRGSGYDRGHMVDL